MSKVDTFLDGLVKTNKLHDFFVGWKKVRENAQIYKDELALLKTISGSGEPAAELRRLMKKYPNIISLIPLLAAVRIKRHPLVVLDDDRETEEEYYFDASDSDEDAIESTIKFAERTGLLAELIKLSDPFDYYFGVEVGMDTNARKNRSGFAMEELLEPFVAKFVQGHKGAFHTQMTFKKAAEEFGVKMPADYPSKTGDFMIFVKDKPINIETNFFDGGGSKQEIMDSYISRKQDLASAGWGFALVTDGPGWSGGRAQVEKGFKRIQYVYNIRMVKEGGLENLLNLKAGR